MSGICFYTKLSGWADTHLPPTIFENIVSTGKPQSTETTRQAYDLWQAWQYCEKQAALRQPLDLSFVRAVSARIMKHTGGETTTSVGRYDTSLGDFRLGEDYDEDTLWLISVKSPSCSTICAGLPMYN